MPVTLLPEIEIKNAAIRNRVHQAILSRYKYQENIPDPADPNNLILNPQTEEEFVKEVVINWLTRQAVSFEGDAAKEIAGKAAENKARNEIKPT